MFYKCISASLWLNTYQIFNLIQIFLDFAETYIILYLYRFRITMRGYPKGSVPRLCLSYFL